MTSSIEKHFEKLDEQLPLIAKSFHSHGSAGFNRLEMTIPQFVTMNLIHKKDCPKMTDLARELNVTLGNMTIMTGRLIKEGYVKRIPDQQDRRVVHVCLTLKGKGIIKKAIDMRRRTMSKIFDKLSFEDRTSLLKIIGKLVNIIKSEAKGE